MRLYFFKVNFHDYHLYFCFTECCPNSVSSFFLNANMLFSFMSHVEIFANPSGLKPQLEF